MKKLPKHLKRLTPIQSELTFSQKIKRVKLDRSRLKGPGRPRKYRFWPAVISLGVVLVVVFIWGYQAQVSADWQDRAEVTLSDKEELAKVVDEIKQENQGLRVKLNLPKEMEDLENSSTEWSRFVVAARQVAKIYNYPLKVILSQCALESARGTKLIRPNNFCGIGANDRDPKGMAWEFENPEQCAVAYMQIIRKNFPNAWANRDNPDEMIKFIKYDPSTNLVYATDPRYVSKAKGMPEWRLY